MNLIQSWCFEKILGYLSEKDVVRLQVINRYFYETCIPKLMRSCKIRLEKSRIHYICPEYLIIFDHKTLQKSKINLDPATQINLWNSQSIEVQGRIYVTGGAIALTKTYLKRTAVLDEHLWKFNELQDMNHARDAHGIVSWRDRYIIVVGSWHVDTSQSTCEMYDTRTNIWHPLGCVSEPTCAPGLVVIKDRYLYKIGGTTDICQIEVVDLHELGFLKGLKPSHVFIDSPVKDQSQNIPQWKTVKPCNRMGHRSTINRCLLYPLSNESVLILGCHFNRSEQPFCYNIKRNRFTKFSRKELVLDMYKSNDIVQNYQDFFYLRPFVKVG